MQLNEQRKTEIINQIKEMMQDSTEKIIFDVEKALVSGALNEKDLIITEPGTYVFAKTLITLHFDKRPYYPIDREQKKLLKNLSYFI